MLIIFAITVLFRRSSHAIIMAWKDPATRGLAYLALTVLLVGTVFYRFVEGLRWLDALYFSLITLTTIGYGDFSPETDLGKIFTIFYVLIGLGILANFINVVANNQRNVNKGDITATVQNEETP